MGFFKIKRTEEELKHRAEKEAIKRENEGIKREAEEFRRVQRKQEQQEELKELKQKVAMVKTNQEIRENKRIIRDEKPVFRAAKGLSKIGKNAGKSRVKLKQQFQARPVKYIEVKRRKVATTRRVKQPKRRTIPNQFSNSNRQESPGFSNLLISGNPRRKKRGGFDLL